MKNLTYLIVSRPRTKRVDIVRNGIPGGELHHVATCESLETARTLVALLNNNLGENT